VTALSYPLSLAGPFVGAWYLVGAGLMYYLRSKRPDSLVELTRDVSERDVVENKVDDLAVAHHA
jgi:hypothetical protein